ncbi:MULTISPECIES: hypothetical protein [unclassified Nodularia (in: cyanobacteria)]|uniref:hypothetical protein n=1 Tax=unclassified Nodularia (in: cyanobacteria) TaxID=2656917 RepID=UPI00187EA69B|nr:MULTISPECIES: hypothetical protein [unclassified Nodularia (in: cyanobacteria)]MBE9202139.1 hypothetical protein [Nodularia sp. LEGE 06071]MCC2696074.1 hypothetical protein [Nodularia sp. LEGE 04288]
MGFSALEKYESQKAAFDNYKAWKALSPDAKQALYDAIPNIKTSRAKPTLRSGFIIPFNATGTIVTYIETKKILDASQGSAVGADVANAVRTCLAGQFFLTAAGTTPVILNNSRYQFAKLSFTKRESFVDRVSRITKRSYKKPSSDTVSMPFGGDAMDQEFDEAVAEIKTKTGGAIPWTGASNATVKQSYKITPEGI